jgi:hypothetical protein
MREQDETGQKQPKKIGAANAECPFPIRFRD